MEQDHAIPLTDAAARLQRSYRSTLDLVLRGKLRGWRDARRRWQVSRDDLERECAERLAREQAVSAG